MPTSQYKQIPKVLDFVLALRPKSVLDIGVGFGKYGFLCREYLEVWGNNNDFIGDAVQIVPKMEKVYDLVLLMDVFEHFHKKDGIVLMNILLDKHKVVLVSVPKDIGDQEDVFGKDHETHHTQWTLRDMKSFGSVICVDDAESLICFVTRNELVLQHVKKELLKFKVKNVLVRFPLIFRFLKKLKSLKQ